MRSVLKYKLFLLTVMVAIFGAFSVSPQVSAATTYGCGGGGDQVKTAIDIGCKGKGNPVTDMLFAFIRFLSNGAGLVIIGSFILGGIQFSAARGDPQAAANAIKRIQGTVVALIFFIFGYALLNYVIPAGFLK
jgi:hypothetical protein